VGDRGTREGKQDVLDAWHFPNGPRAETRPSVSVVVLVVDRDLLAPLAVGRQSVFPVLSVLRSCVGAMFQSRRMFRTRWRGTLHYRYRRLKRPRRLHHHRRIRLDLGQLRQGGPQTRMLMGK
jgi:hypothetical protein